MNNLIKYLESCGVSKDAQDQIQDLHNRLESSRREVGVLRRHSNQDQLKAVEEELDSDISFERVGYTLADADHALVFSAARDQFMLVTPAYSGKTDDIISDELTYLTACFIRPDIQPDFYDDMVEWMAKKVYSDEEGEVDDVPKE